MLGRVGVRLFDLLADVLVVDGGWIGLFDEIIDEVARGIDELSETAASVDGGKLFGRERSLTGRIHILSIPPADGCLK